MESFEKDGHWWLPRNPDRKIGGVLKYDSTQGCTFRLFDLFDRKAVGSNIVVRYNRIFGVTSEGDYFTLIDCHRGGYTKNQPIGGEEQYSIQYVLKGVHWDMDKNISFDSISLAFPLLDQWSDVLTTVSVNPFPLGLPPGSSFNLAHQMPTSIEGTMTKFQVKISEELSWTGGSIVGDSIDTETRISLEFSRPQVPFAEILEYIDYIRYLITIGYNRPVRPRLVSGMNKGLYRFKNIEIFYGIGGSSEISRRPLNREFYFVPTDVGDFQTLIENWNMIWERYRPVLEMHLSSQFNPDMYAQSEFLSLIQAIEAFHRRKFGSRYIPQDRYSIIKNHLGELIRGDPREVYQDRRMTKGKQIREETLEKLLDLDSAYDIGNDFGNKLDSVLEHANELSLRQRLKHLVNIEYDHLIDGLPHSAQDQIHSIVETRHHYIHQLTEPNPAVREGSDVYELVFPLRQLIEAILLDEIGLPKSQIREKLTARYSQIYAI